MKRETKQALTTAFFLMVTCMALGLRFPLVLLSQCPLVIIGEHHSSNFSVSVDGDSQSDQNRSQHSFLTWKY